MSAFTLIVHLQAKPDQVDRFLAMALENAAATRSEDRSKIAFYEVYDDKQAFEAHLQTAHFKKYFENAVPLLAERERSFFTRVAP